MRDTQIATPATPITVQGMPALPFLRFFLANVLLVRQKPPPAQPLPPSILTAQVSFPNCRPCTAPNSASSVRIRDMKTGDWVVVLGRGGGRFFLLVTERWHRRRIV